MALKISSLEQRVEDIENKLTKFNGSINELVSALKTALIPNLEEIPSQLEDQKYIS